MTSISAPANATWVSTKPNPPTLLLAGQAPTHWAARVLATRTPALPALPTTEHLLNLEPVLLRLRIRVRVRVSPVAPPSSVPANPPPPPPPAEAKCIDDNNSVVKIDGTKYSIRCKLQIRNKKIVCSGPAATLTDCLKMCNNNNNDCKSVDFCDPNGSKTCYLLDSPDAPAYKSGTNLAACVA